MSAIFTFSWVRKLIGKLGVPYNRTLGVRGSSHPLNKNYDTGIFPAAAESKALRIHSDLSRPERCIAPLTILASSGESRAPYTSPLASPFGNFGLPIFFFIFLLTKCLTAL